jgi:predicted O-methyltransferase YrrM
MLPNTLNHFLDQILLTTFKKVPVSLSKRILELLYKNPTLLDSWGYHLRPFHYYEPLPDFSTITQEQTLKKRYSPCINWNLEAQLDLVKKISKYDPEIEQLNFDFFNDFYRELDAAVYYALLRQIQPAKVIEIGCGYSTQIATLALSKNQQEGKTGKIICIEPYPEAQLTEANLEIELITERVENINLKVFAQLGAGDILFIDSTHTVKFSSDVCREILEILPTISSGVLIHFHDIFFPYDYPAKWLIEDRRAWNEQYMLEAFLAYNHSFEVVLANHLLSVDYLQEVAKIWQGVSNWQGEYHRCGSFWIRKK